MREPVGVGIWLAFPSMLGLDAHALATMLKLANFDWVAPRGAEGAHVDPHWTAAHTKACNDLGLRVYRWTFSRPGSWHQEVDIAARFKDEGDSGYIIDAESAWEGPGTFDIAALYCDALDSKLGNDYFIADAPWPYVSYHWSLDVHGKPASGFPFHAFAKRMNARMPQAYWTEIGAQGAAYHLPRIDMEWQKFDARFPELARPVWPIGITYGRTEMQRWGAQQLPPGEVTVEDIVYFDNRYRLVPRSYYSREASSDAVVRKMAELNTPTVDLGGTFDNTNQPAHPLGAETAAENAFDGEDTLRSEQALARFDAEFNAHQIGAAPQVAQPGSLISLPHRLQQLPADRQRDVRAFFARKVGSHPA